MPQDVEPAPSAGNYNYVNPLAPGPPSIGPGVNANGSPTHLTITGQYNPQNIQYILIALGILLDGQYRENMLPAGVYNFVEKYVRTAGNAPQGLYCYNFCLDTNPRVIQPSGATNGKACVVTRLNHAPRGIYNVRPGMDGCAPAGFEV